MHRNFEGWPKIGVPIGQPLNYRASEGSAIGWHACDLFLPLLTVYTSLNACHPLKGLTGVACDLLAKCWYFDHRT